MYGVKMLKIRLAWIGNEVNLNFGGGRISGKLAIQ